MTAVLGVVVPGLPHPLLCPDAHPGYARLRAAYAEAGRQIEAADADVIVVYATQWPSVLGHQVITDPAPTFVHVDELFHELGSIPYTLRVDAELAEAVVAAGQRRGLHMRGVNVPGFPIDTGTVVALELLDPGRTRPAIILSSNVYADRAETIVLAKAVADAVGERRVAVVTVNTLSNRFFTDWITPEQEAIHSAKDDEFNRKLLQLLGDGRLEDTAQLSRSIHQQIRVKKVVAFKPLWFLSALCGAHNRYRGEVLAYEPVHGAGCAVVTLTPSASGVGDREFDEDDVEVWKGDGGVIRGADAPAAVTLPAPARSTPAAPLAAEAVHASKAPRPVGAYPHARRVGDLIYVSGTGPRQPGTDEIPGGPIRDADGNPRDYDIVAQTHACIRNIAAILEAAGSGLHEVVDVTSYLVNMERDFAGYNQAYAEHFAAIGPTRTTLAVLALPTPIAVELKVIAQVRR